jgi:hypothetical protein
VVFVTELRMETKSYPGKAWLQHKQEDNQLPLMQELKTWKGAR